MTRKDFDSVAATLREEYETALQMGETFHAKGIAVAAKALADTFAQTHPRFNADRFKRAALGREQV